MEGRGQSNYLVLVKGMFEAAQNKENSLAMERYMKNLFPFLGIKTPERRDLTKRFYKESDILSKPLQIDFILELWEMDYREYQYLAVDYLCKFSKSLAADNLSLLKILITNKSWWDTVDTIASKAVGQLAKNHPWLIDEHIDEWATDTNMWLRRTAILFQLKYKEQTEVDRLFRYIKLNSDSREFFIQKAIGWALREYSKTNPEAIKNFIATESLAKLSVREGSKYLN